MKHPSFDRNGYPTEATLRAIKKWPRQDFWGLAQFVCEAWYYPDYIKRKGRKLQLCTGGWSGNEDIIRALMKHFIFWSVCWQKSERGGAYWFELPKIETKEKK